MALWPQHWLAWQVWLRVQTLWRVAIGMGGAWWQGLDYLQVQHVMDRIVQVPADAQVETWHQLQIMEDEARHHLNQPGD